MYIQLLVCLIIAIAYNEYRTKIIRRQLSPDRALTNYIYFVCALLILQSGLRNVAVGTDTYAYLLKYEAIQHFSWDNIFDTFIRTYQTGEGKDPGYLIFMKLISTVIPYYQIYLLIIAAFFFTALGSLLKTFCRSIYDVFVGTVLYEVLYYGFFSVTGIRQTIAVGILFFGVKFIVNRKIIPFIITCFCAAIIHKSALIFIPLYFIADYKKTIRLLSTVIVALPVIFVIMRPFAQFLTSFSFSESYATYSNSEYETTGAKMFFIYMLAVSIMALLSKKYVAEASQKVKLCYNAFCIGVLFTPLTWVDPSLMRVVMYFSVFGIFFLGDLVREFCKRYNLSLGIVTLSMILTFALVIIKRGAEYAFFWQEMALPEYYNV